MAAYGDMAAPSTISGGRWGAPPSPTNRPARRPSFTPEYAAELQRGLVHFAHRRMPQAIASFQQCCGLCPWSAVPPYNLACCHAAANDLDQSAASLRAAVDKGFDISEVYDDDDLQKLTAAPWFKELLRAWKRGETAIGPVAARQRCQTRPSTAPALGRRVRRPSTAPAGVRQSQHHADSSGAFDLSSTMENELRMLETLRPASGKVRTRRVSRQTSRRNLDYLRHGYPGSSAPARINLMVGNLCDSVPRMHRRLACECWPEFGRESQSLRNSEREFADEPNSSARPSPAPLNATHGSASTQAALAGEPGATPATDLSAGLSVGQLAPTLAELVRPIPL